MIYSVICIVASLMWPLLFCYYADLTTNRMAAIGNDIYCLNWYDYPFEVRKYLILMIAYSQERIYFNGFNFVSCTLVTFSKVRNFMHFQRERKMISSWLNSTDIKLFYHCRLSNHLAPFTCFSGALLNPSHMEENCNEFPKSELRNILS